MTFKKNDRVILSNTDNIWDNKEGIILADFDNGEISEETIYYVVKILFDDNKPVIQIVNKDNLELATTNEMLHEEKEPAKEIDDYIKNYVYVEDLDGEKIDSWFFVDKIASVENIPIEEIIYNAKILGYNIYSILANTFEKIVIAAPRCATKTVYDEYGSQLLGKAEVIDLTGEDK